MESQMDVFLCFLFVLFVCLFLFLFCFALFCFVLSYSVVEFKVERRYFKDPIFFTISIVNRVMKVFDTFRKKIDGILLFLKHSFIHFINIVSWPNGQITHYLQI